MERVLPRDAFNDANLLKCIGALTMAIEDRMVQNWTFEYDGEPFDIQQDESDGSTRVENIEFQYKGKPVLVFRPVNSRQPWPLKISLNEDYEDIFDDKGEIILK